jgi:MFS superfamily sulfate permease-like transporter
VPGEHGVPRFSWDTLRRDAPAGVITGLVAIPLTVGICLMSEFPIQIGLFTVVIACVVSFLTYLVRPGNHVGVPGVAAGLAPVLAMGVHRYGMANMPWIIFLTSMMQMLVWKFRLEGHILKAVPPFLIEGLLAGVGLKIALKFLPYTYAVSPASVDDGVSQALLVGGSVIALVAFLALYQRFHETSPGVPYIFIIGGGIVAARFLPFPMLEIDDVPLAFAWPLPDLVHTAPTLLVEMVAFALMLMSIDVIEQVMSNAAIEKIDPYGRKADSNNSLLVMWLGNAVASFFGGMTNLDGLAKSATNRMAGAVTKMSVLFVAAVLGLVLVFPEFLTLLPEFALAVLMIFTGWKMIAGLVHTASHGKYGFGMAMFCGILVFKLGIFEGLVIALLLHSFITYVIYRHEKLPTLEILKKVLALFSDRRHAHATSTMHPHEDHTTGGVTYSSVTRAASATKDLDAFIADWAFGVNSHNLLTVVGTYDVGGLLWGTFAKDLRAGHVNIKRYFEHLFELDRVSVHFDSGETRQYKDIFIRSGSYSFSYFKKDEKVTVPARYSFVCKREPTGWYIVEHHSSQFPA